MERVEKVDFGGYSFDKKTLHHFDSVAKHCEYDLRLDDGQTAFLIRDLVFMMAEAKMKKYNKLKAREVFPLTSNFAKGIETINYEVIDWTGEAKVIANDADDYPNSGTTLEEKSAPVRLVANDFYVTDQEMLKAAYARRPLSRRRLDAALLANETKIDNVAFLGDANYKLPGLFTSPSDLNAATIANTGTGSSKKWSTKDAAKIEIDIKAMITLLPEQFIGEDLILVTTPANYRLLTITRIGTDTQDTIADFLIRKTPIKEINFSSRLKSVAAISNKDTALIYPKSKEVLDLVIPRDREQKAPFRDKRKMVFDIETELSGLHIFQPEAIVYADEV